MLDTTEFERLLDIAAEARDGDSNDEEIDALRDVVSEACGLLGIPER